LQEKVINKNVDIKFSAQDAFLEKSSSGDAQNNLHQVCLKSKDLKTFIRYAQNLKI